MLHYSTREGSVEQKCRSQYRSHEAPPAAGVGDAADVQRRAIYDKHTAR